MLGSQFAHLAGTDDHNRLVVEAVKNLACQFDSGKRNRHRIAGNRCFGAYALGDREGLVQKTVEDQSGSLEFGGVPVSGFDLAENLRFAEHHRIEARSDAEEVADRILTLVIVQMFADLFGIDVVIFSQIAAQRSGRSLRILGRGA